MNGGYDPTENGRGRENGAHRSNNNDEQSQGNPPANPQGDHVYIQFYGFAPPEPNNQPPTRAGTNGANYQNMMNGLQNLIQNAAVAAPAENQTQQASSAVAAAARADPSTDDLGQQIQAFVNHLGTQEQATAAAAAAAAPPPPPISPPTTHPTHYHWQPTAAPALPSNQQQRHQSNQSLSERQFSEMIGHLLSMFRASGGRAAYNNDNNNMPNAYQRYQAPPAPPYPYALQPNSAEFAQMQLLLVMILLSPNGLFLFTNIVLAAMQQIANQHQVVTPPQMNYYAQGTYPPAAQTNSLEAGATAAHPAAASAHSYAATTTATSVASAVGTATATAAKRAPDDDDDDDDESKKKPVKKKRRPYNHESFPCKLHRLLRECKEQGKDYIVRWLDNGKQFEICSTSAFETDVLPLYFRHGNISSFKRLMRMYDFRRTRGTWEGKSTTGFAHAHDICTNLHPCSFTPTSVLMVNLLLLCLTQRGHLSTTSFDETTQILQKRLCAWD